MSDLDHRSHAYRADLADQRLEGRVEAARFVSGRPGQVTAGVADLRRRPGPREPLDSQLLFGEQVTVFDEADGWAWVQNAADGYVGYTEAVNVGGAPVEPTHRVRAMRAFVHPEPELKCPPTAALSIGSLGRVDDVQGAYSRINGGGWIYSRTLQALDRLSPNFVATAEELLGVPYLWGGRSGLGLDCSSFVQIALSFAGLAAPRDSDQQEASLGEALDWLEGETKPERGDLLFGKGHIAIAYDRDRVLHCNAYTMSVAIEPRADLAGRLIAESGTAFTSRRRVTLG